MFRQLKNHPFAVEAYFNSSLVLTFAVPYQQLQQLVPECLELDLYADKWAFLAVAMVDTSGLRPKGFPAILGNDFFLVGYRVFVRYTTSTGKRLRGLYILQSETNKKKMEFFGNLFTHYNYKTIDVQSGETNDSRFISSHSGNLNINKAKTGPDILLPAGSPFPDWKEARRYAGPLPFTFTYDAENKSVLIIEGVRQNWTPIPVKIQSYQIGFLQKIQLKEYVLANAFEIRNVPYHWKKGKTDSWKK